MTQPRLGSLAWFVDGIEDLWQQFHSRDMKTFDLARREPEGDQPPRDPGNYPIIFTAPSDTGLEYEFAMYLERRERRGEPPAPAVSPDDPLGIERCAHHTVLADQLARARRLYVDMLGGHVIHEGHNEALGTRSTYIGLADAVIEFAEPLEDGSPAQQTWQRCAPDDTYYQLTWQVGDIDQVTDHLKSCGVGLLHSNTVVVTDPADTLGVPWGFTSQLIPGDPRA